MIGEVLADFAGVVSVGSGTDIEFEQAFGLADRAHEIPATVRTQFAIASGTKGFTALAVLGLIADGLLTLASPVRPILSTDLPLITDDVTVEHLLTHRFAPDLVTRMTTPLELDTGHPFRYGIRFWLAAAGPVVLLDGCDHGVSLCSWHDPSTGRTATVLANTTDGAWPVAWRLGAALFGIRTLPG